MIDSIYPRGRDTSSMRKLLPSMPVFRESCSVETRTRVQRCLSLAVEMVERWEMPRWGVDEAQKTGSGSGGDGAARDSPAMPPPTILLRALEPLPAGAGEEGAVSNIDVYRGSKFLGWENYERTGEGEGGFDLIKAVADVPGHHFNLFQEEAHADVVTEKVRWACELIDRG